MGHVDHQIGPDAVGDLAAALEVDDPAIGGAADDDQPGLLGLCGLGDGVVVHHLILLAHLVGHRAEPLAGLVHRAAVGQMAAGRQIQAHEGLARLQQGHEHGLVGLRPGVRLHIGEAAAEQGLGPVDGDLLGHVDPLAALVVTAARVALGVLVGQHRALSLEHRARDDVLRGDQLDVLLLTAKLALDHAEHFRIRVGQAAFEHVLIGVGGDLGRRGHGASGSK